MNVFENGLHFAFSFGAALDGHSSGRGWIGVFLATPLAVIGLASCLVLMLDGPICNFLKEGGGSELFIENCTK